MVALLLRCDHVKCRIAMLMGLVEQNNEYFNLVCEMVTFVVLTMP